MSGAAIAAALGLISAPGLGATIAQAFDQMGPDAVFGPNCGSSAVTTAIIAPPRWRAGAPARWRADGVTLFAEVGSRNVTAVHLANPIAHAADEAACAAQLRLLAGPETIESRWQGPDRISTSAAPPVAGRRAQYRAVYSASRHECRTMLTIAAGEPS